MTSVPRSRTIPSGATLVTGRTPLAVSIAELLLGRGPTVAELDLREPLGAVRAGRIRRIVHVPDTAGGATGSGPAATVGDAVRLLEAARLGAHRTRIVLLSSTTVYGDRAGPIAEETEPRPRTPAAVGSLAVEQVGEQYGTTHGVDVIVLRLGHVYGRRLDLPPAIGEVVAAAAAGIPLDLSARCHETFHLVHIDDARRAVQAALDADGAGGRVFNVTDGETHSLCQVAERIRDCHPDSRIETGRRRAEAEAASIDIRAADRALGYRPRWGLARGIDDYVEWFSAHRRDGTAA